LVGDLAAVESGLDVFGSSGTAPASAGSMAATETGVDTAAAAGAALAQGDMNAVEPLQDGFSSSGTLPASAGSMAANEAGFDVFGGSGLLPVSVGSMAATEALIDQFASTGALASLFSAGDMAATEAQLDSLAAAGVALIVGAMGAVESAPDVMGQAAQVDASSGGRLKLEGDALKAFREYARAYQEGRANRVPPKKPDAPAPAPVVDDGPYFPPTLPVFTGQVQSAGDVLESAMSTMGAAIEELAVVSKRNVAKQKAAQAEIARGIEIAALDAKAANEAAMAAIKKANQAKRNQAAIAIILLELA